MPRALAPLALLALSCSPAIVEGTSNDPASTGGDASAGDASTGPDDPTTSPDDSTSSSPPATDDSGPDPDSGTDESSGANTTTPSATCGNAELEGDELCDDGNADESDGCTSKCAPPSCDDDLVSGDETDLDCGGMTCGGCDGGQQCESRDDCAANACVDGLCAPLTRSCRELHDMFPGLPDEAYYIDPDGDGQPVIVYCDMQNGGWTEAAKDTLESADGWSLGEHADCPGLSDDMLGPFGMGETTMKGFTLLGVPHEQARLHVDIIVIDSWDGGNERVNASIDGQQVGSQLCEFTNPGLCGQDMDHCESMWPDGKITLVGMRPHNINDISVSITSTLNEPVDNESWAVDLVSVFVY